MCNFAFWFAILISYSLITKLILCMHISTNSQTFWEAEIHRGICLSPSLSGGFDLCLGRSSTVSSPFTFGIRQYLVAFCICRIICFKEINTVFVDMLQLLLFYRTEDYHCQETFCFSFESSSFHLPEDWSFLFYSTWRAVFHSALSHFHFYEAHFFPNLEICTF